MARTKAILGIGLSLAVIFSLILAACAPKAEVPEKPKVIKIGVELDLTGPYAYTHRWWLISYREYIDYINEKGGINGIPVEFIWADCGFEVPRMISTYERAKESGVILYGLSTTLSTDTLKAKIDKDKLPTLCLSPSQAAAVPAGYTFLVYPTYENAFCGYIDWFVKNWKGAKPPKLGILTIEGSYGRAILAKQCLDYVKSKGVEIVATELIPTVPLDTTPNLVKIRDAGADFIFGGWVAATAAPILRDMKKLGFKVPVASFAPCPVTDLVRMTSAELSEGYISLLPFASQSEESLPGIKLWRELQLKYEGKVIPEDTFGWSQSPIMVMVEAVRLAAEKVPYEQLTGETVKKFGLDRMKNFDTGGLCGLVTLEKGYAYGTNTMRISQAKGGKTVFLTDWFALPDVFGYKAYYDKEVAPLYK